ncbi:MAG TPA: ABC transporter permease [Candidatus Ozemobacteraceae bacterium]|nr:ABC transporter permease [Candidatus Ozemobacteraceae bacterium]
MDSTAFLLGVLADAMGRIFGFDAETFAILGLSLKIAVAATIGGLAIALPLAALIHACRPPLRAALFVVMQALVSVPTVIIGTLVYLFLSRRGPLGALELLYTPAAIILGDILLVVPLLTVFFGSALRQVPAGLLETARNLGASRRHLLILLARECRGTIAIGACIGFGRVISELGVAMILGGNIRGFSRTLTTAMALEMGKGETGLAIALGMLLLVLALGNTLAVQYLQIYLDRRPAPVPPDLRSECHDTPSLEEGQHSGTMPPSPPRIPPLHLRGISMAFDGRPLFEALGADLDLTGGLALMGASGSGKTTLLRLIAGLVMPDAGSVDRKGRKAVMTFQRPYLFAGTVRDNLEYGLRIRNASTEAVDALARELRIDSLLDRSVRHLSGGEAARVSIGRALAVNPHLLLLDEALAHLDRETLVPLTSVLRRYIRDGGGLLLVTHDPHLASAICSRTLILERGRLSRSE